MRLIQQANQRQEGDGGARVLWMAGVPFGLVLLLLAVFLSRLTKDQLADLISLCALTRPTLHVLRRTLASVGR
jgi:hypothetical protein